MLNRERTNEARLLFQSLTSEAQEKLEISGVSEELSNKGSTEEALAEKSGMRCSASAPFALGNCAVQVTTSKTLLKFAQALGTTVELLFFGDKGAQ